MLPRDRDLAYLWDMREAARLIQAFIQGATYQHFVSDKMMRSAVERQLEIMGEAARRVSIEFQLEHPEIPWRQVIGLRNLLAHEYGEVQVDRIWSIINESMGELAARLDVLIPPIEGE